MKIVQEVLIFTLVLMTTSLSGQYLETFSIPNKGLLAGPCGVTAESCGSNDFNGVDWTITGNFSGFDSNDIMATDGTGELFVGGDIDNEMCYVTPVLDISTVAGNASLSVDLEWVNHDIGDYIDVEYMLDGAGPWTQIPPQFGTGPHTVEFNTNSNTGAGTVTQGGLSGSSLTIRVCVDTNTGSSGEATTIDDVSVPEVGAMILPVTWGDVRIDTKESKNMIHWSTYSEINNDRFEIEHTSSLERPWKTLGTLESNGDTQTKSNYSYADQFLTSSINYYRIKQIDLDGQFDYSEIVYSRTEFDSDILLYPNPVKEYMTIQSNNAWTDDQHFLVFDAMGKQITLSSTKENDYTVKLNTSSLESGIYFIQLSSGNMKKIIKL